ncbi:endonuclease/exonuclease/phosphatase family protein [Vibrio pectenicida]|uniref:Endonuclease/exonuclease/phosphatase family protein n=1 Tax=Vibrio pectenicida TaxID=62763 RepID=A0A3R9KZP3_9VIBR|nr:endonuclease/exonuclease/phosphatase family protein [Vibrio pectenicida]RSD29679.1 endonuclease/exonuclease/phosphatase family protein [Vibrio pectenicida]
MTKSHHHWQHLILTLILSIASTSVTATPLSFTTWNIEWLTSKPSKQFVQSKRTQIDLEALANHFESTDTDILAFQEVNDLKAIRKVVGQDYDIYLSQRASSSRVKQQFKDINQYTGFAVRKGIPVENLPDLQLDKRKSSKLRFATYMVITPNQKPPVHLLSVHLKARCSGAYNNNRDCQILESQGKALNQWILEREKAKQQYMILGDFNHNLSYQGDWLWGEITQSSSAILATISTQPRCKVRSRHHPDRLHQFRSLIDHIIISKKLSLSTPEQVVFPSEQVLKYHLSDHCPLRATLE